MYCGGRWRHKTDDMCLMKKSMCIVGEYEPMDNTKCVIITLHDHYRCPECKTEVYADEGKLLGTFSAAEVSNGDEEDLAAKCDYFKNRTAYKEHASECRNIRLEILDKHNHIKED